MICFANFHQSGNWKLRIRNVVCRSRMQLNIAERSIENRRKHIQRNTWEYIYMHVCVCVWKTWSILNGLNAGQLPGRVCSRCIYIERIYVCLCTCVCVYFMYVYQFVLSLLFGTEWVCINQPFSGTSISTRFIALDFIFNKPFLCVFSTPHSFFCILIATFYALLCSFMNIPFAERFSNICRNQCLCYLRFNDSSLCAHTHTLLQTGHVRMSKPLQGICKLCGMSDRSDLSVALLRKY